MRITIILLILTIISVSCIEDEDAVNNSGWEKEWGSEDWDSLYAIAISPDDRIYVGGQTLGELYAANIGIDAVLANFNSKGEELWGKQWGNGSIRTLVADEEGNIYAGGGDIFNLIKISSDGKEIWRKVNDDENWFQVLTIDSAGNIYGGKINGEILKFSPDGKELWHHNISTEDAEGEIKALAVDSEGNIYAGGIAWNNLFGESAGHSDAFLVKIAPDKTHVWEKQWGGEGYDRAYSLAIDNMNNIYVGCGTDKTIEILLKFSSNGKKLWGNEGTAVNYNALVLDEENNLYVGIGFQKNLVEKYTSDGEKIWDTNDEGKWEWSVSGIALDSYGNLYICGGSEENHLIKIPASEME